jgi:hypothetical protein
LAGEEVEGEGGVAGFEPDFVQGEVEGEAVVAGEGVVVVLGLTGRRVGRLGECDAAGWVVGGVIDFAFVFVVLGLAGERGVRLLRGGGEFGGIDGLALLLFELEKVEALVGVGLLAPHPLEVFLVALMPKLPLELGLGGARFRRLDF